MQIYIIGYIIIQIIIGFMIKIKSKRNFASAIIVFVTIVLIYVSFIAVGGVPFSVFKTFLTFATFFGFIGIIEIILGVFHKKFENKVYHAVLSQLGNATNIISSKEITNLVGKPKKIKYVNTLLSIYKKKMIIPSNVEILLQDK